MGIQVPGQAGGSFKIETLIAYRAETMAPIMGISPPVLLEKWLQWWGFYHWRAKIVGI